MNLAKHIETLQKRHIFLEREIHKKGLSPSSQDIEIHNLKKRRLKIKEEINKLIAQSEFKNH